MFSSIKLIVFTILALHHVVTGMEWDYNIRSPNVWPLLEGEAFRSCKSNMQSPIHIRTEHVQCDATRSLVKPIQLVAYNQSYSFNFSNSALTIQAQLVDRQKMSPLQYTGSGLKKMFMPFEFRQLHFHWGQNSFQGSEHIIDNKTTPLELHLVHVSSKDEHYFAVIGILFIVQSTPNPNLEGLLQAADYLATHPNSSIISQVNLTSLLPEHTDRFYYYEGSLTTPPCTERVFWTVMADKIGISEEQLKRIQANPTKTNFRPIQPVNERGVTTIDCELAGLFNSATTIASKLFSLVALLFFLLF